MPNPPGVGTLLVFGWCNIGSWLAQNCLICYYGRRLMLGQRYSTSKLISATVAVEPTLNHRLGFVWRMPAGWYPDRIPQDQIPQYEKWTKSHSMKCGENKCQQLYRSPQWQCVHIAQHMIGVVWFEVNRLPWNNTVTYVKGHSSVM